MVPPLVVLDAGWWLIERVADAFPRDHRLRCFPAQVLYGRRGERNAAEQGAAVPRLAANHAPSTLTTWLAAGAAANSPAANATTQHLAGEPLIGPTLALTRRLVRPIFRCHLA